MIKTNREPSKFKAWLHNNAVYLIVAIAFAAGGISNFIAGGLPLPEGAELQKGWIQLAALAVSTGVSIFKGIKQNKAAKDLEKLNQRPDFQISEGTKNNLALARVAANEGLPEQVYNNYLNQLNLTTSSALRNNLLYGRGNVNMNTVSRVRNEGIAELNAQDAEARRRNRRDLMDANQQLASEERKAFEWDAQQYQDRAKWAAELRQAGDENIMAGIGAGLSAVASGQLTGTSNQASSPTQGANITSTPQMGLSARGIRGGLQDQYNRTIQDALRRKTLVSSADLWRGMI